MARAKRVVKDMPEVPESIGLSFGAFTVAPYSRGRRTWTGGLAGVESSIGSWEGSFLRSLVHGGDGDSLLTG